MMITKDKYEQALTWLASRTEHVRTYDPKSLWISDVMDARDLIVRHNIAVSDCYLASDAWQTLVQQEWFIRCANAVSDPDEIREGRLAVLFGMTFWTDAFMHPDLQFIEPGTWLFMGERRRIGTDAEQMFSRLIPTGA